MSFELVFGDRELILPLNFDGAVEERLIQLLRRDESSEVASRVRAHLAQKIAGVIAMAVDGDVLPPTEKQVKYAIAIARELSLELPSEVLQFRDAMTTFLTIHAEQYRRRKGYAPATPK